MQKYEISRLRHLAARWRLHRYLLARENCPRQSYKAQLGLPDLATWEVHLAPKNRRWRLGDLFSRIWCFWRVFRTDLATKKRSLKCSMYIAPCTRRQGKGVENRFITIIDCLKNDYYRKSQKFFDADGGDFWQLPRPLLATCGPKYLATLSSTHIMSSYYKKLPLN